MKVVHLNAIQLRAGEIASKCNANRAAVAQALVNAHVERGFEIKTDGATSSRNSLDFGSAGSFDPNKTQPLEVAEAT